ncbi:MAG: tetratricopeptide repeat protein [Sandaracinaceae bacterium]|nr:tetratricopeptide repeat protein [Sandaracinaceae bacterium]
MTRRVGWIVGILVLSAGLGTTAQADRTGAERVLRARERADARPGDPEARLGLVVELVESGQPGEALAELDLLDALAPTDPRAPYWRARALVATGRPDAAEDALRDALDGPSLTLRGELREERGARALALEDYLAASAVAPAIELDVRAAHLLERLSRLDEAARILDAGARRTGSAVLRVEAAELARRMGRYDVALAHLDALAAARPSVRWELLRASILRDAGREAEAVATLARARAGADRAVERRGSALAYSERAQVRLASGDRAGARLDLERAARLAPAWVVPRQLLSSLGAGR